MRGLSAIIQSIFKRLTNFTAAGTTTITTANVDSANYDLVVFTVALGPVVNGTATTIKILGSTLSGSGHAALAGCTYTVLDADDNQVIRIEIAKPKYRHMKCEVARATQNVTIDGIFVELHNGRTEPVTQDSTVSSAISKISPELA